MTRNRQAFFLFLLILIAAGLGPRQLAAQLQPAGPETRVDTDYNVYSYSDCPQIGVAPDRSFEIGWSSGLNGPTDVRARHYDASGSPTDPREVAISREFDFSEDYFVPSTIAVNPVLNGFRVLYSTTSSSQTPKFFRRKTDPNGVPVSGAPRPVGLGETQWVLPGPGDTLFAGKYDASRRRLSLQKVGSLGKPSGPVYVLNTRPFVLDTGFDHGVGGRPVIRPLSDGGWVAVFGGTSVASPGSPARPVIRARRFNAVGAPLGPDFDVNNVPAGRPGVEPFLGTADFLVAARPAGQFAVAWKLGSASAGWSIRLRIFNAAGIPTAPERVVARDGALESLLSMAADNTGRLLLVWLKGADFRPDYPTTDLRARLIGANGAPLGPAIRVQSVVSQEWDAPVCGSVAWAGDSWLITWLGYYLEEDTAIFLRQFR